VLWVLTPNSPLKQGAHISPLEVRLELLQAAIADLPGHVFSDVEIRRPAPQYALDTVRQLRQDFPEAELIYLVGGDSLRGFSIAMIIGVFFGCYSSIYILAAMIIFMKVSRDDLLVPVQEDQVQEGPP